MTDDRLMSRNCAICDQRIEGLRFTQKEASDLNLSPEIKLLIGIVCLKCESIYCGLHKHKKELSFSVFRGYWTCPSCGYEMGHGKGANDLIYANVPEVLMVAGRKNVNQGFISNIVKNLDLDNLKKYLRSGKWISDEGECRKLIEQAGQVEEQLMRDILKRAYSQSMEFSDRSAQKDAFLEWAALASIGADWALTEKYVKNGLYSTIRNVIDYKIGVMKSYVDDADVAAALLLIELSRLARTEDFIPLILIPPQKLHYRKECNFVKWFFARLWIFIDDERVEDYLIKALDETTSVITEHYAPGLISSIPEINPSDGIIASMGENSIPYSSDKPAVVPGLAYHAAELLLMNGTERGIAALVPAVLAPKQGPYYGSQIFESAHKFFTQQQHKPRKMFETLTTKNGQLSLLSKYLINELKTENFEILRLAVRALGTIGDQEAVNKKAIPMMFERLAIQPQGFLDSLGGNIMSDLPGSAEVIERELQSFESLWMTEPFINGLKHKDYRVRLIAVRALQRIGDGATITVLTPLLEDDHKKVQKATKIAIRKLQS